MGVPALAWWVSCLELVEARSAVLTTECSWSKEVLGGVA